MLIILSNIKTQLGKSVSRIQHTIFMLRRICVLFVSLKMANIEKLEVILCMLIRWSKRQNPAWEPG